MASRPPRIAWIERYVTPLSQIACTRTADRLDQVETDRETQRDRGGQIRQVLVGKQSHRDGQPDTHAHMTTPHTDVVLWSGTLCESTQYLEGKRERVCVSSQCTSTTLHTPWRTSGTPNDPSWSAPQSAPPTPHLLDPPSSSTHKHKHTHTQDKTRQRKGTQAPRRRRRHTHTPLSSPSCVCAAPVGCEG